jgi:hypothetical protein
VKYFKTLIKNRENGSKLLVLCSNIFLLIL